MTDSLQKYLAELFGTFTLVFIGTMGVLSARAEVSISVLAIALAFGLALLAGLYAFAEVSGGHFNPIVSLAMVIDRRLNVGDMLGYWVAQFVGAILASLCVLIAFDQDAVAGTATVPGAQGAGTAFFLELLASAVFVFVILQSTASERHGGTALLAIPLTLAAIHLALVPWSGSSVNTARSFGPALIGSEWTDFWVYVVAPPLGAVVGWLVYKVVSTGALMQMPRREAPPTTPSS